MSDTAVEYLAELVKNREYGKLSVINHLFDELKQDYAFYCHEENDDGELAESILGALFLYFDKVQLTKDEWAEIIHTGDEKKDEILVSAYMQFLLNQVTENTRSSAKYFDERNKQYE